MLQIPGSTRCPLCLCVFATVVVLLGRLQLPGVLSDETSNIAIAAASDGDKRDSITEENDTNHEDASLMFSSEAVDRYRFELEPYRVLVELHVMTPRLIEGKDLQRLSAKLVSHIHRNAGATWSTRVVVVDADSFQSTDGHRRDNGSQKNYDKVFRLAIGRNANGFELTGSEFDVPTQQRTSEVSRTVIAPRFVAHELARMTAALFRPVAIVDTANEMNVRIRLKAGLIACPNPNWNAIPVDSYLTTYRLYFDRDKVIRKRIEVPWTFLKILKTQRAQADCKVISAFRAPLAGIQRRVETRALVATPLSNVSELRIERRNDRRSPTGTLRVNLAHSFVPGKPVDFHSRLVTDRRGTQRLSKEETPIQFIFVYSGDTLLARVPVMIGLEEVIELEVPDDETQLSVDGQLNQIKSELIDIVARRTVMIARVKLLAKQGKFGQLAAGDAGGQDAREENNVSAVMKQIELLPGVESFRKKILAVRVPAVARSESAGDRAAVNRINKQCDEMTELVKRYLDDDKLKQLEEQVDEWKTIDRLSVDDPPKEPAE